MPNFLRNVLARRDLITESRKLVSKCVDIRRIERQPSGRKTAQYTPGFFTAMEFRVGSGPSGQFLARNCNRRGTSEAALSRG